MKKTEAKKTKKRLRESTETSKAKIFHKKTKKKSFLQCEKCNKQRNNNIKNNEVKKL